MIFTRSILDEVLILNSSADDICAALNNIGLEVESFKRIVSPENVVVGKIVDCQKHPDATKLNVCQVAIAESNGEYEIRQIVCGAKNAREGIFVAVALEGAVLPQVTIKKAKLRGVDSCGMLCSSTELGFPYLNDGIMELDNSIGDLVIGKNLREYPQFNDEVYEVSITPNRGDCMSLLGIARDLGAAFGVQLSQRLQVKIPDNAPGVGRVLQIVADDKISSSVMYRALEVDLCRTNVRNSLFLSYNESLGDDHLKNALNFSMLYSGVLLNAYPQDFCHLGDVGTDKITLHIKKDEFGFDGVFANDKKLSSIGINSYIANKDMEQNIGTKFMVLEASYIPPHTISSIVYDNKPKDIDAKIFQRSSRGSNPDLLLGLDIFCDSILNNCSGDNKEIIIYSDIQEVISYKEREAITVDIPLMSKVIGKDLNKIDVINILKALEFGVDISSDDTLLSVIPPLFRHDINNIYDISEEVIRFIGINNVVSQPLNIIQKNQNTDETSIYKFRRNLSKKAIYNGFYECVHFIFFSREKLKKYGFEILPEGLDLSNPITNDLNTLRTTLLCSLLDSVVLNRNNGFESISLFELGSAYDKNREEKILFSFIQSGFVVKEHYPNTKGYKGGFFEFANRIASVVGDFELVENKPSVSLFHPSQCAKIMQNNKQIGIISSLHPKVSSELGLDSTYMCEIEVDKLDCNIPCVKSYSRFQKTTRDLSVIIHRNVPYFKIKNLIASLNLQEIVSFYPLDVYNDEKLGENSSLTIRFELQSMDKTLEEKDMNNIMASVLEALKVEFNIELR